MNDSSKSFRYDTRERGITQFYLKMQSTCLSTRLSTSEITQINHTYLNSPAAEHCYKSDRYSFPVRHRIGGWVGLQRISWCIGATLYVAMVTCHHHFWKWWWLSPPLFWKWKITNTNFSLYFGQENRIFLATRSVLWPKICRKCDSSRGSAPDPAGGAHDAPPDSLVGWGVDTPPHTPPHSAPLAPRCSRLWRLDLHAPWYQILATPLLAEFRKKTWTT